MPPPSLPTAATEADRFGTTEHAQQLDVRFHYPVIFTRGLFSPDNRALVDLLRGASGDLARVLVVVDGGLHQAAPALAQEVTRYFAAHPSLRMVAEPLIVPGGEQVKNDPAVVQELLARMFSLGLDRHAYLLALGGGAVLDAVGYAAALFHRGLRLVRVPTTVLAQDDAGVGVKNGVNAFGVKNALGTFAPPFAVLNDSELLRTLPARERIAGLAEAVKVALIRDASFFAELEHDAALLRAGDEAATERAIRRCAELHLAHIRGAGDPFETGSARPLDFGHWAAHKLELMTAHALRHGEAVAIGMAIDIRYAALSGLLAAPAAARAIAVIAQLGLPTSHPAMVARDQAGKLQLLRGLEEFREHLGGRLCVTMLVELGEGRELDQLSLARMAEAIEDVHQGRVA